MGKVCAHVLSLHTRPFAVQDFYKHVNIGKLPSFSLPVLAEIKHLFE